MDYIAAEPVGFIERAARKFCRFWNVVPNAEVYSGNVYRIVSVLSFGPVLLLAAFCVLLWRRTARTLVPIYLLIGYFTLVHMVTIASLRYRLPIEPFLIVMAAYPTGRMAAVLPPPIGRPVRSTGEQAMQHGEEDGTFEREPMIALTGELLDDAPAPGLLPQPFEHESRPDAPHVGGDRSAVVDRIDDDRLGGEARAGS
jgi:hypothetical protein